MTEAMITTIDNPFDPFDQFDEWYAFDTAMGYHSCSLLARITLSSHELSDADQARAIEQAIDSIIELNIYGDYRKVLKTE